MATVDASIPLGVQQPQLMTPNQAQSQALSLRDLQLQTQLRQQQVQQGQNSLAVQSKMAQWAAQPGNVDKLTGQATDQGMQSLSTFAPTEIVQKFAGARQEFEKKNADQAKESEIIKQAQTKQNLEKQKWIQENVREPALIAYKDALKGGLNEQAAIAAGQRTFSEGIDTGKTTGLFGKDEFEKIPTQFDPKQVAARSQSYKEYMQNDEKQKADKLAEDRFGETERHNRETEVRLAGIAARGNTGSIDAKVGDKTGDELLKTLAPAQANTVKAISEGRMTFNDLGIRGQEREKLVKLVNQYDPTYDAADAKSRYKAMNDFSTGKNGNTVRSLNVSIDHLDTLAKAGAALKNGDTQLFNKWGNEFAAQTGQSAPTDFNATKKIVADEIVKGIVGSGGGVSDREEAAKSIAGVNSPKQLASVIDRYKDLLGGQLNGLKKQYEATTKRTDFSDRFLTPESKQQLEGRGTPKAGAPGQVPQGVPSGSKQIGKTPDGHPVWQSADGKKWVE